MAQVALEAGNSPRMVFSNYRELVRPKDAEAWFGLTPASVKAARKKRVRPDKQKARMDRKPENVVVLPGLAVG